MSKRKACPSEEEESSQCPRYLNYLPVFTNWRLTLSSFRENPVVTLEVGRKRARFYVHKDCLCNASPFFKAAFTGGFKENSGTMELPDDKADTFEQLVQWVYRQKIELALTGDRKTIGVQYDKLIQLYLMADKYSIVPLKNTIMGIIYGNVHSEHYRIASLRNVKLIYENTVRGSRMRRFVTQSYAWSVKADWYQQANISESLSDIPEFAGDLAVALALWHKLVGNTKGPFRDLSHYLESPEEKSEVPSSTI